MGLEDVKIDKPKVSPDVAKVAPEKQPELAFKDSSFGKLVEGAQKAKEGEKRHPGTLKKRVDSIKPKAPGAAPDKQDLKDNADKLAAGSKEIKVTKASDGRETVSIKLDGTKIRDVGFLDPSVKVFDIKTTAPGKDGGKNEEQRSVTRDTINGVTGYFYKDNSGKKVQLQLPKDLTDAEITIKPENRENWTEDQVLEAMKAEARKAQRQTQEKIAEGAARKTVAGSVDDGLTGTPAPSRRSSGGSGGRQIESNPSPVRGGSSRGYERPAIAPLPSLVRRGGSTESPITGSVEGLPSTIEADDSPTGKKIEVDSPEDPELQKRQQHILYALHGDGSNAKGFLSQVLVEAKKRRRNGENVIVVSLEYDPGPAKLKDGTKNKNQFGPSWNFLDGKVGALFDHFDKDNKAKIDVISFSGGYRGVKFLVGQNNGYSINSISFLDSSYNDKALVDLMAQYVKSGGKVLALTATGDPARGAGKIKDALNGESDDVRQRFVSKSRSGGHNSVNLMAEGVAFGAAQAPSKTVVPRATEIFAENSRVLNYPVDDAAKEIINGFRSDEPLVPFSFGKRSFKLRETTLKCLEYAQSLARQDGKDIMPTSAFRSMEEQKSAFARSDRSGKWVAVPGKSNHQAGAAADLKLVDKNTGRVLSDAGSKALLEQYMNRAGFVRYSVEWWHFELGSGPWVAVMQKAGILSRDVAAGQGAYPKLA